MSELEGFCTVDLKVRELDEVLKGRFVLCDLEGELWSQRRVENSLETMGR